MSPLFKIPFILATTGAVTASLTIPSSSLSDNERRPNLRATTFMRITEPIMFKGMGYIRAVFWVAAAVEIAAILVGQRSATSAPSNHILKMLMTKGRVDDLRLTPVPVVGMLLVVAGSSLRLWCFRTLKNLFTFEVGIRENHRLVTSGPYGFVRHPAYTGSLLCFIGLCCWFGGRGSWVRESGILGTMPGKIFVSLFAAARIRAMLGLLLRMPVEDGLLKTSFGEEWEEWARQVSYWLIPGLY